MKPMLDISNDSFLKALVDALVVLQNLLFKQAKS